MAVFRVYFNTSSTKENAGRRAMSDVADALGLVVEMVNRWNDETCTPLPGCDEEAASVCSVEDILWQFVLDSRCRNSDAGWQPIPRSDVPVDIGEFERAVDREAGKLGASARPTGTPLGEWLQTGIPPRRPPGHRPFFNSAFKNQVLAEARDLGAGKFLVHEAVSKVLGLVLPNVHLDRPDAMAEAKHRAARFRACLIEEIRHYCAEHGISPSRQSAPAIVRAAWAEASRPDVATDGGKIITRIAIRRMGRTLRFDVVADDVKAYFDLLRGRGQPVPENWRAGFSTNNDGPADALRQAKDRLAALQLFLLHEDDVEFLEAVI